MEMTMSKTNDTTKTRELNDAELALVLGGQAFEIKDYSFDIEQTLSIGSQTTGAGAGRVK
jgi:hypothetical protein